MEHNSDRREEHLQILPAQVLLCGITYFLQEITAGLAGLSVHPRKREIIVLGLEVVLLLLSELGDEPSDDT